MHEDSKDTSALRASCASSASLWINRSGRLILAAVFIVAGALKIVNPIGFARDITDYDLAAGLIVPAIAVVLPWWEVAAGVLAIAGRWRIGALTALTGMSAAFLIVGAITFARGLSPECGCFGFMSERVGPMSLTFEAALLLACVLLLRKEFRRPEEDRRR